TSIRPTFRCYGGANPGYKTHHLSINPSFNSEPTTGCKSTHYFGRISALDLHYATPMVPNLHPEAFPGAQLPRPVAAPSAEVTLLAEAAPSPQLRRRTARNCAINASAPKICKILFMLRKTARRKINIKLL
ncbi:MULTISPECIES: hypothetical protein, partial [unclassified Actinotignum]|uniref:hypothetical protein n=1 Tax=unclassified Actinotignum TaxID=2632702 RepID=UPI003F47EF48